MIVQVLSFYQLQASRSFYSTERFMSTEIYNFTNSSSSIRLPFLSFLILAVICQIVAQNCPNFSRTVGATKRHACQNNGEQEKREKRRGKRKERKNHRRREQYEISEEESSRLGNIPRWGSFVAQKTPSENIALKRFTKTAIKRTGGR